MDRLVVSLSEYDRLHLIANNSRFLILPEYHYPNLASRILSLCERRIVHDWQTRFGYPLLLLETFVDPRYFQSTIYRAANWVSVGKTCGFRRVRQGTGQGYSTPVRPLTTQAQWLLSQSILNPIYRYGAPKIMLTADQMRVIPDYFAEIPDPRRKQGQRHSLASILAIATGVILCGMVSKDSVATTINKLARNVRLVFDCQRMTDNSVPFRKSNCFQSI